jgi:hypothetical protein
MIPINNNRENISSSFLGYAFMRMPPFYQAFVICIRTIECSDPSLLADIDPKLVKKERTEKKYSSSFF